MLHTMNAIDLKIQSLEYHRMQLAKICTSEKLSKSFQYHKIYRQTVLNSKISEI